MRVRFSQRTCFHEPNRGGTRAGLKFYFDENQHRSIVLFAGGSGITPMMSMLRYIDKLCLDTRVTLFYSVRTQRDIIFERKLNRLQERLPHFQQLIVPTQPDHGWIGRSGRLSREMIVEQLDMTNDQTFFLCGPEPFMEHVGSVLQSLGVSESRILRETFGNKSAETEAIAENSTPMGSTEFARSAQICALPRGRTLLEVAEVNGVNIPYKLRARSMWDLRHAPAGRPDQNGLRRWSAACFEVPRLRSALRSAGRWQRPAGRMIIAG